jgi:uncharacterized protein (DUF736 family)
MKDKIGALWIKNDFFTGTIKIDDKEIKIVVFKNTYKEKDNQPDYNILLSRPKTEEVKSVDKVNDIYEQFGKDTIETEDVAF